MTKQPGCQHQWEIEPDCQPAFHNTYECDECGTSWEDTWSCGCDGCLEIYDILDGGTFFDMISYDWEVIPTDHVLRCDGQSRASTPGNLRARTSRPFPHSPVRGPRALVQRVR